MDENVEVRNICDWVRFKDSKLEEIGICPVNLIPANEGAARVYMLVRRQTVNVFNGESDIAVDLNHLAVWAAIDHSGIEDPYDCFIKVIRVFHCFLEERMDEDGGNVYVSVQIDGKEIGNAVAKQLKTNGDLRRAVRNSH